MSWGKIPHMSPQNLAEWLVHLESLHPKTIALGLERVAAVRNHLQLNPPFPVIIVGGTNGKGSVCAMLEAMLHAAGYRVGLYTSPHLIKYNERVRIAGQQATDDELCASFSAIEQARSGIALTYFEFGTLAAMQIFIARKVDVAILEVGLGGRLDAVNVFDADCAVVTSIDLDHIDYLGDTREKIAYEKAGIFRKGKAAIFGDPDMPAAIADVANKTGARLLRLGQDFKFEPEMQHWHYRGQSSRMSLPFPALRGAYQLNNASAVLAVLDVMQQKLPVSMDAIRRGLVEVELAGRFQVKPGLPVMIFDVAHNPHAARALAANLAAMPGFPRTWAVCAMLKDKDMAGVVKALGHQVNVWLLGGINAPRGATAAELALAVRQAQPDATILTFDTVTLALRHACEAAHENDRIVAFGSFYTVAEAMQAANVQG